MGTSEPRWRAWSGGWRSGRPPAGWWQAADGRWYPPGVPQPVGGSTWRGSAAEGRPLDGLPAAPALPERRAAARPAVWGALGAAAAAVVALGAAFHVTPSGQEYPGLPAHGAPSAQVAVEATGATPPPTRTPAAGPAVGAPAGAPAGADEATSTCAARGATPRSPFGDSEGPADLDGDGDADTCG